MASPVHLVTRIQAQPTSAPRVEEILRALVQPSREEAGCLGYELLQDLSDPARYLLLETWESQAAFETHFGQPAIQEVLRTVGPLLAAPPEILRARKLV